MEQSPNNDFDQYLKGTLDNASVEAPPFVWDRIEKRLSPVTSWYSKYKYLLLLLLLSFTSASSIFIYKNFVLKGNVSTIALNKQLYNDGKLSKYKSVPENIASENASENLTNNPDNIASNNPSASAPVSNTKNPASVASFYNKEKSTAANPTSNQQNESIAESYLAKREKRMNRLQVKNEKSNSISVANVNQPLAQVSTPKPFTKKSIRKGNISVNTGVINSITAKSEDDIVVQKSNVENSENELPEDVRDYSYTDNSSDNSVTAQVEDVTKPIVEPAQKKVAEPLTASAVPVKVQQAPISGKDVLRSVVSPKKLEKLDMKSSAPAKDLDPAKKKMQRNIKQFAGYDINKGFHLGAFFNVNNNWLNHKSYSADETTTSIKPKVNFGIAYGLNIGYDYTDRWGIELEWQVSQQGQKYAIIRNQTALKGDDGNHTKDIKLTYTRFPVLVKYKHSFLNNYNKKPVALSFLVGPQLGFLLRQKVYEDGVEVANAPQYNKSEVGLTGGFDFDLYVMRYMYLTLGARTSFSSPTKKGQPMSFQVGITTQLNFRFAKKIK